METRASPIRIESKMIDAGTLSGKLLLVFSLVATLYLHKGESIMTENFVVRARIGANTKAEASAILESIGLTVSDAIRLMLKWVVAEKVLPFELLVPNEETIEAIKAARRGDLKTAGFMNKLFQELNEDD